MTLLATWISPYDAFNPAFAQRALLAVLIIAVSAAALGGSIVLRDLPFFTHAIGTGAYPALVVAVTAGVSLAAAAIVGALAFAVVLALITVFSRNGTVVNAERRDALTGIAIAAALAIGAVLASTIGRGNARLSVSPEALLFGSILTVNATTLVVAGLVAVFVAACWWLFGERWLASGFDPGVSSQLRARKTDTLLLICIALAAGATLTITGSLLAGALLVAPAATARVVFTRASAIAPATFLLALTEGVLGLYLSIVFDFPSGAAIAAVAGVTFLLVAAATALFESRRAPVLALFLLGAVLLAGCGSKSTSATDESGPIKVVATSTQVGELVKEVGGSAVDVTTLLPAGVDPHDYEPKPSAVAALSNADVIFRSGGDIDGWLAPAVKAAGGDTKPVDLSTAVTLLPADEQDAATAKAGEFNAHWYLAPDNVASATRRVRDELIKADPTARETFRANANSYLEEIDTTKASLARCVKKVPAGDLTILTGHNDFSYLAKAFDINIASQLAESGESEPSVSDVQNAVDQARSAGARAVVVSKGEVTQLAQQVAKKLNVPLLQLYADSLSKSGQADTLLGAITYNVDQIVGATSGGSVKC